MADKLYDFSKELDSFKALLDKYNDITSSNEEIIRLFQEGIRTFGNNSTKVKETLDNFPSLKEYYEKLKSAIEELKSARIESAKAINSLAQTYVGVSEADIKGLFELQKKVKDIQDKINEVQNKPLDANFTFDIQTKIINDLNEKLKETNDEIDELKDSSEELTDIYDKLNTGGNNVAEAFDKFNQSAKKTVETTNQIKENIAETAEHQSKVTAEAEKTLKKYQTLKETLGAIGKFVGEVVKANWQFENAAIKTGKAMGMSYSESMAYHKFMLKNTPDLLNALAMPLEEVLEFQNKFSAATNRSINLTKQQLKIFGSMSKMIGDETANELVSEMDKLGNSLYESGEQAFKLMADAKKQGLNLSNLSKSFANNLKLAHSYNFKNGVDGVRQMTVLSERLKFNLESISTAADNMTSVEGAISTAANIQKLGGAFAMNFSDPMRLMYESWNDFESLTERIVDTVKGKATFNRETGEMQMGSLDRRFLQEYAKALGVSFEDVFQMATQQAKYQDMESSFQRGLSEEQKTAVGNRATYNPLTGEYQVTYYDTNNNQKTTALRDVNSEIANQIIKGNDTEDALLGKASDTLTSVQAIEGLLKSSKIFQTTEEKYTAAKDQIKTGGAQIGETVRPLTRDAFDVAKDFLADNAIYAAGALGAYGIGKAYFNSKGGINRLINKRADRNVRSGSKPSKLKQFFGSKTGKRVAKAGKWGAAIAGTAFLASMLMGASSGEEAEGLTKQEEINRNTESKNKIDKTNELISTNQEESEYQTKLLEKIEQNTRGYGNYSADYLYNLNKGANSSYKSADALNIASAVSTSGMFGAYGASTLLNLFGKGNGAFTKKLPAIGNALMIGGSIFDVGSSILTDKANKKSLDLQLYNGDITKQEYISKRKESDDAKNRAIGDAVGSLVGTYVGQIAGRMLGTAAGGAIGTLITPGAGTAVGAAIGSQAGQLIGSAGGYWLGGKIGSAAGTLFNKSSQDLTYEVEQTNRVKSFDYETSKFGKNALTSDNIAVTALQANIKSSDILASIYDLLSKNFDSDSFREERNAEIAHINGENYTKWYDPFGLFGHNDSWFSNGGIVTANNGLASIPGNSLTGDKVPVLANSREMILNTSQQKGLFKFIDNLSKNIRVISEYESPTFIKNDGFTSYQPSFKPNSYNQSQFPTNLNLNISGNINLNANGQSVSLKELINDATFKRELAQLIMHQMSKNSSGGRINYNDIRTRQNSFYTVNNI